AQFKRAVQDSNCYEDVGDWLLTHGIMKTPAEIKKWSDKMEAARPMQDVVKRAYLVEEFGLNPESNTTFDWLEADDRASFKPKPIQRARGRFSLQSQDVF